MTQPPTTESRIFLLESIAERQEKLLNKIVVSLEGFGKTNWNALLGTLFAALGILIVVVSGLWVLAIGPMKTDIEYNRNDIKDSFRQISELAAENTKRKMEGVALGHEANREAAIRHLRESYGEVAWRILWREKRGYDYPPDPEFIGPDPLP